MFTAKAIVVTLLAAIAGAQAAPLEPRQGPTYFTLAALDGWSFL